MPGDLRLFFVAICARCILRPRQHQFFRSAIELAADRCLKRIPEQNSQKYVSGHAPLAWSAKALFLACALISNWHPAVPLLHWRGTFFLLRQKSLRISSCPILALIDMIGVALFWKRKNKHFLSYTDELLVSADLLVRVSCFDISYSEITAYSFRRFLSAATPI
jgi:hypothetical protein